MIIKWSLTVPELTGDLKRRAYAYIPESYRDDPEARYPVLYMFDGHNLFFDEDATYGRSWRLGDYLDATETQLMVVGIECNHSPDGGRLSEYAPYDFSSKKFGSIKGRGDVTMRWFTETLKPFIDSQFPTIPDRAHTFIGGSSMGGLMSIYAVAAYNHIFGGAACLSPSVWFGSRKLDKLLTSCELDPDTRVYMDYGERELPNHASTRKRLFKVAERFYQKGAMLTFRMVPYGEHNEASWEKQIGYFLGSLLYGE